jgi:TRAP-type transport system periplasmic protein
MKKIYVLFAIALSLIFGVFTLSGICMAQQLKPMTLKMADMAGENTWFGKQHKWWASEVEKRSEGKIKVQIFWMDSLIKTKDALPGVQSGMADMAWVNATYFPSQLPNFLMLENLFNYGDDYVAGVLGLIDTVDNEPTIKAELAKEDIILLCPHLGGHSGIGTKKCINSPKDLKGRTLRTYGGVRTQFYTNLGANPIFMTFGDLYEALDRGTVDAIGDLGVVIANAFKIQEIVKCMYLCNPPGAHGNGGALASGFFMSRKKFNAFPQETQKMFMDLRKEYGIRYAKTLMRIRRPPKPCGKRNSG